MKTFDVVALGELLVDFTENGISAQGNPMLEANPGGAPCNVLSMLQNQGNNARFARKIINLWRDFLNFPYFTGFPAP